MKWWEAVLWTLGVIASWPALLVVGDRANHWFQNRQTLTMKQHRTHQRKVADE
jgi:hypothetical protein